MCGHAVLPTDLKAIRDRFDIDGDFALNKIGNSTDVVRGDWVYGIVDNDAGQRYLSSFRWGFTGNAGGLLYNARYHTAADKRIWRDALSHRRLAVPVTGFYEEGIPFSGDDSVMLLAGIWRKEESGLRTVAILTVEASGDMRKYHNRVPAVLSPDLLDSWLDRSHLDGMSFKDEIYGYNPHFRRTREFALVR